MNTTVSDVLEVPFDHRSNDDFEALRLYYVAVSRARKQVLNAIHL